MTFLHLLTSRPQKEMRPRLIFLPTIAGDGSASEGEGSEPAFAPPIKLDFSGYDDHPWNEGAATGTAKQRLPSARGHLGRYRPA